jgi:regulator of cell morphogenesis and NO signaling
MTTPATRQPTLTELCDHIVEVHHAYLRRELPVIGERLEKVAARHGEALPQMRVIDTRFAELRQDLLTHIGGEEEMLFPFCQSLDEGGGGDLAAVAEGLRMHETAHADVLGVMEEIRELAGDYVSAQALCSTHAALLESLHALDADLRQHVHEENEVLFPRLRERVAAATA